MLFLLSQDPFTAKPTTNRVQSARFALVAALYKEQIGAAIKRRRKELDLTQKQLADLAHVEEGQTVSRWERGVNSPTDLEAVAGALQTTVHELLAGLDPIPQAQRRRMEPHGLSQLDRIEDTVNKTLALLQRQREPNSQPSQADQAADAIEQEAEQVAEQQQERAAKGRATRKKDQGS